MDKKIIEKIAEMLMELAKPKKYEAGYADANRIVQDGLAIIGLDSSDILGFVKPSNERAIRRLRGTQAWFNNMYKNGWRYVDTFEYEGLPYNGFVVMERELPNKTLDVIKEELNVLLRDDEGSKYMHVPNPEILRIVAKNIKNIGEGVGIKDVKITKVGDLKKAILKTREPREGFESDVSDFMIDAKKEMKTDEEIFFEETGKNAVWRGSETKAFKLWKKGLNNVS